MQSAVACPTNNSCWPTCSTGQPPRGIPGRESERRPTPPCTTWSQGRSWQSSGGSACTGQLPRCAWPAQLQLLQVSAAAALPGTSPLCSGTFGCEPLGSDPEERQRPRLAPVWGRLSRPVLEFRKIRVRSVRQKGRLHAIWLFGVVYHQQKWKLLFLSINLPLQQQLPSNSSTGSTNKRLANTK